MWGSETSGAPKGLARGTHGQSTWEMSTGMFWRPLSSGGMAVSSGVSKEHLHPNQVFWALPGCQSRALAASLQL